MSIRRLLALVAIILVSITPSLVASPASASSGEFVGSINSLRASKGLPALGVDGRLSSVAQDWANQMAAAGKISHRPNLGGTVSGWSKIAENVGVGGSTSQIFSALTGSAGHYRNMVDGSFNAVGVGVATGADGRIYTAHNFAQFGSAPAPAKAAPAPAAKALAPAPAKAAPAPARANRSAARPVPTAAAPAPAPAPEPVVEAPAPAPEPVAPPKPQPSQRISQGIAEVGSIATQG